MPISIKKKKLKVTQQYIAEYSDTITLNIAWIYKLHKNILL